MFEWWNSLETLRHLLPIVRWGAPAAACISLIALLLNTIVSNQIDRLTAQQAEQTKRQLTELQERARSRTIDSSARRAIIDRLLQSAGQYSGGDFAKIPVVVRYVQAASSEPREFAEAIAGTIREAGWEVPSIDSHPPIEQSLVGLVIQISDISGVENRATALQQALTGAGIAARAERTESRTAAVVFIVGLKP